MTGAKETWFEIWFNSPYYHLLYQHRDDTEAQHLIDRLSDYLQIPPESTILDLACGKGRHARYLAQKGFEVSGIDLSPESIAQAKQFESENLRFYIHDMREVFHPDYFHYIFNFFTSFGYFENIDDNYQCLNAIFHQLKNKGYLVLDFFNTNRVIAKLVAYEEKEVEGVRFFITRRATANHIIKTISVIDESNQFRATFVERVQALTLSWFEKALTSTGFTLTQTWGNYELDPYSPQDSERLILLAQKG
ncbi:MAG: methyltransferase domain-containing protein [Sphingobacteriales bacterium]|nr:MAG: methyltransferase domain-containing protein [Sphingobacteriales bacterium]